MRTRDLADLKKVFWGWVGEAMGRGKESKRREKKDHEWVFQAGKRKKMEKRTLSGVQGNYKDFSVF